MNTAQEQIRRHLASHHALYVPSVIAEAAELLTELQEVASRHEVSPASEAAGWLVTAAAESISARHGRPAVERTVEQVRELSAALAAECARLGLNRALAMGGGQAVAVEPVPGGPTWGINGTGLAVWIYLDSGWQLGVNAERTPMMSIYAPATPAGAGEVAELLADILHGRTPDPFRDRN